MCRMWGRGEVREKGPRWESGWGDGRGGVDERFENWNVEGGEEG